MATLALQTLGNRLSDLHRAVDAWCAAHCGPVSSSENTLRACTKANELLVQVIRAPNRRERNIGSTSVAEIVDLFLPAEKEIVSVS